MTSLGKSALWFAAIGLALYLALDWAAEALLLRTGRTNAFFKIETAQETAYDWIILGASHAMPLDFSDFNAYMRRETGKRILNLASPGTGPLYNRFVLEHFLERHRTAGLLYVLDSFAFYSPAWNEERFADAKLLRGTPLRWSIARRLLDYSLHEGVSPLAPADYVIGFSKLNNRERFQTDVWEGEAQFDRVFRPSPAADRKRIDYLYPSPAPDREARARYLGLFASAVDAAQRAGIRVVVIKPPLPAAFYRLLPDEADFDAHLGLLLQERRVPYLDFSLSVNDPRMFFDTDHLNRSGATRFVGDSLKAILGR